METRRGMAFLCALMALPGVQLALAAAEPVASGAAGAADRGDDTVGDRSEMTI